ncbi:MAG: DUF3168 domain-containing protein [Aliishimia sp.]
MSYATSFALQSSVYSALIGDAGVNALVGDAVYDALPPGHLPPLYVSLGTETARDASDKTGYGAWHIFTISVLSTGSSFAKAKSVAAAICDALIDQDLNMDRGRLVSLGFDRARALRIQQGSGRQIDLRFRARVEDN